MTARDERRPVAAVPDATRGGEDTRRRGWFWHWNALITQYAPLIGLKGVGLLNSYTVWTDRREESPHRGYAFPSQQREADFYGEDRAELIVINKILVALDLIEIRKELVSRTDSQGRRWKVPHNFYRVKDHDDGFTLGAGDVLRVAELAARDKAVYRYVRRVFSPKFAPIDDGNPWHAVLAEVRQHPTWQELAARAAAEEDRASARTRAGHAARNKGAAKPEAETDAAPAAVTESTFFVPEGGDGGAGERVDSDSATGDTRQSSETVVASINTGSVPVVALANNGSRRSGPTVVGRSSRRQPAVVEPTNTTYDQSKATTTRSGVEHDSAEPGTSGDPAASLVGAIDQVPVATGGAAVAANAGFADDARPVPGAAPDDGPGRAAAIRAFEEANAREATPAERRLLAGLAERFEPAAAAAGSSGWAWLADAIYEAVEAGSRFVAPRRAREILTRWERDGCPQTDDAPAGRRNADNSAGAASPVRAGEGMAPAARGAVGSAREATQSPAVRDAGPRGRSPAVANVARVVPARPALPDADTPLPDPEPFVVEECGLTSGAVWAAVLTEVVAAGSVSAAEFAAWVKPTLLLGRAGEGPGAPLVVGASHPAARRRIEARHLAALRAAAGSVLGRPVEVEIAVTREWLLQQGAASAGFDGDEDAPARRVAGG